MTQIYSKNIRTPRIIRYPELDFYHEIFDDSFRNLEYDPYFRRLVGSLWPSI